MFAGANNQLAALGFEDRSQLGEEPIADFAPLGGGLAKGTVDRVVQDGQVAAQSGAGTEHVERTYRGFADVPLPAAIELFGIPPQGRGIGGFQGAEVRVQPGVGFDLPLDGPHESHGQFHGFTDEHDSNPGIANDLP
jgi:hypothetical protein